MGHVLDYTSRQNASAEELVAAGLAGEPPREASPDPLYTYTVVGIHEGGDANRFAEAYEAESPSDAEALALAQHPALLIAGVVEGECKLVDTDPGAY